MHIVRTFLREDTVCQLWEVVQISTFENTPDVIRNVSERDESPPFEKPQNWTNPDENRTAELDSDVLPTTRRARESTAEIHSKRIVQATMILGKRSTNHNRTVVNSERSRLVNN